MRLSYTRVWLVWYVVVLLQSLSLLTLGRECTTSSSCRGENIDINQREGSYCGCRAFKSCADSSFTTSSQFNQIKELYCLGSYSCHNGDVSRATTTNSYPISIYCYGAFSCLKSDLTLYQSDSVTMVLCHGYLSCYDSIVSSSYIECTSDESCSNMNAVLGSGGNSESKGIIWVTAHAGAINSILECSTLEGAAECDFHFAAHLSGYNATVICGNNNVCNINCYLTGCYGLTVKCNSNSYNSQSCTINKNCTHSLENDFCDGLTTNNIKYPLNVHSLLSNNPNYSIPNLLNNIDIFSSNNNANGKNVLDSTYYDKSTTNCNANTNGYTQYADYLDAYGDSLYIDINYQDGVCCMGQESCTMANFDFDASYTVVSTTHWYFNCDGVYSCYNSKIDLSYLSMTWSAASNNNNHEFLFDIYLTSFGSSYDTNWDFSEINNRVSVNVFITAPYSVNSATIKNGDNIYLTAHSACVNCEIINSKNIYSYGIYAMNGSYISNIDENLYCIGFGACFKNEIYNVNGNIYALGSEVIKDSVINTVEKSVIIYGLQASYGGTIKNIGEYVFCIGQYSCSNTNIVGITKGLIAYGDNSLANSDITTNNIAANSETINIEINGNMNDGSYSIKCSNGDACYVECQSKNACKKLKLYCYGECIVSCEGDFECPINANGATWVFNDKNDIDSTNNGETDTVFGSSDTSDEDTSDATDTSKSSTNSSTNSSRLEEFENIGIVTILIGIVIILIGILFVIITIGKCCACCKSEEMEFMACAKYLFQLWDFCSDCILLYDILDHYFEEPEESKDKETYFKFACACGAFILLPWLCNLCFLWKARSLWINDDAMGNCNNIPDTPNVLNTPNIPGTPNTPNSPNTSALKHCTSNLKSWMAHYSSLLVALCMLSGGLTASLKVVNSKLFGSEWFNMKLPKYKQEESSKYKLWLTVVLENIPQILISTSYGLLLLGKLDRTVLFSLISSSISVFWIIVSTVFEYPKDYYIYEMKCQLKNNNRYSNPATREELGKVLRQTKILAKSICSGIHANMDHKHLFVENAFYNALAKMVKMNVVSTVAPMMDLENISYETKEKIIKCFETNHSICDIERIDICEIGHHTVNLWTCKNNSVTSVTSVTSVNSESNVSPSAPLESPEIRNRVSTLSVNVKDVTIPGAAPEISTTNYDDEGQIMLQYS